MRRAAGETLKLGKGTAFVKTRLRRLPQTEDEWEAGFRRHPSSGIAYRDGLVVSTTHDLLLADRFVESVPTVNDIATLLGDAMQRPLTGDPHRPRKIQLEALPCCDELVPHLEQLGIEVLVEERLPRLEEEFAAFVREVTDRQ